MKRILIVDDHPIVRDGVRSMLAFEEDVEVVGEAEDYDSALEQIQELRPDLVIVDLMLKGRGGLELISSVADADPEVKCLVLSAHTDPAYAERALEAGAAGYVAKGQATAQLVEAIHVALGGEIYVGHPVSRGLVNLLVRRPRRRSGGWASQLSPRELEIFELVGQGKRPAEIAEALAISGKTVETHMRNIRKKLGFRDGRELAFQAFHWVASETRPGTSSQAGSGLIDAGAPDDGE